MATTTNYGWTTPDDTALVKDGAAAIRSLGTSVDTTTKALNPSTTLGDIEYRSSTANTNTRLALGTAGQVLTVNSGATAPEWATSAAGGMTLLSTTTLSGTSTTISSISQSYNALLVVLTGTFSVGTYPRVQWNGSTTLSFVNFGLSTNIVNNNSNGTLDGVSTGTTPTAVLQIWNYTSAAKNKLGWGYWTNSDSDATKFGFGGVGYGSTSAITSITITSGSGTATLGGTVLIYGVK